MITTFIPRHHFRLVKRGMIVAALTFGASATLAAEPTTNEIVTQPARDVGIEKTKIPAVLEAIGDHPYNTARTGSCAQIAASIAELSSAIGPDYSSSSAPAKRNIAKVGGAVVVNSLIPFRGIVREISGASAAERRKNAAVDAGIARRGFLRGLQLARQCRR